MDIRVLDRGLKITGLRAIKQKSLVEYLEVTMGAPDGGQKHSAATTLAILGLHWYQERTAEGRLDHLGTMADLHRTICQKIRHNQMWYAPPRYIEETTEPEERTTPWKWGDWEETSWDQKDNGWQA